MDSPRRRAPHDRRPRGPALQLRTRFLDSGPTPALGLACAVAGGTAVVLVVGAVLVSMLLAVAITEFSVTVCAVVLRSLLNSSRNQH